MPSFTATGREDVHGAGYLRTQCPSELQKNAGVLMNQVSRHDACRRMKWSELQLQV